MSTSACLHRLPHASNICAVCSASVPGPERLAARLRGRYADKQPQQTTLSPGQHTLTLVRGADVSEVDIVIRPRQDSDSAHNVSPDAYYVAEVVAVRGCTILPLGHVEVVRMSVGEVQLDNNTIQGTDYTYDTSTH